MGVRRASGGVPSASRTPIRSAVATAKAGARTRRLIFCRGAAARRLRWIVARLSITVSGAFRSPRRTFDACSEALISCRIAHAGKTSPGTASVASCFALAGKWAVLRLLSRQLFAYADYLFYYNGALN